MSLRYFSDEEFTRAQPSCTLSDMDFEFMDRLDLARLYAGVPFLITSAYRSEDYERSKGRSGSSSHCKGLAVDIHCNNSVKRLVIIKSLLRAGFRRIGIAKSFIHVDLDIDKPKCIWLYD